MKSFSSEIDDKKQETTIAEFDKAKQIEQQERVRIKIAAIKDANEKRRQEEGFAYAKKQDKILDEKFRRAQEAYVNEKLKHQPENKLVFKGDRRSYEDRARELRQEFLVTPEGKGLQKDREDLWNNHEQGLEDVVQKQNKQEMVEQRRSQMEQQYEEARQRASEAFERASQCESRNPEKGKDLGIEIE